MRGKFYVTIVWSLFISFLILTIGCEAEELETEPNVIKLAALLPMSGELGSKGEIRKLALERGVEDANTNWLEEESELQFELKVEDSQSDPDVALTKAKQLWEEGYEIFIAGSSAELETLQPWATEHGAIVISYSSTSPALGTVGDGIFRMVPDDTQQAKALANLLEYERIYGIVPVYRNDIYGSELTKLLTEEFEALHGKVADPVTYQPQETDWDHVMVKISEAVNSLEMEQERMAIVLIAFDEITDMLLHSEAADITNEVRWFGSDTVTLSPVILEDKEIAQKAAQVNLTGVTFGIPDSALFHSIQSELETFSEGAFLPDALFAYDIPGMLASVIAQLEESFSTEALMNNMVEGSASYAGVTGWTLLNEKGDRQYYHYDIWEVQAENENSYAWHQTAKYLNNPGALGYIFTDFPEGSGANQDQVESFLFGYEGEKFDPERALTRAEFTYMLMNATNRSLLEETDQESTFADAKDMDERAKNAVAIAQDHGIVEEDGDRTFRPNQEITWLEAIVMLVRTKDGTLDGLNTDQQLDSNVPEWAHAYIQTAMDQQWITLTAEEFANMMNEPVLLGEAMLMMIEITKGDEDYEQVGS